MPLTAIQSRILRLLAANRSPESYLAGATVLHRADESPRYSQDLDLFHDLVESVSRSAAADATTLAAAGHPVTWLLQTPAFRRGVVTVGKEQLKLEWAQDSAFRFFPVQKDNRCGYRLHDADAAVNKILALAGRNEVRDYVDVLHVHDQYLSLGALAWAACGKDPGFTPEFLLDQAGRHVAHSQADLDRLRLRQSADIQALKRQWQAAVSDARELVARLPPGEVGCLYLTSKGVPVTPDPRAKGFSRLTRHHGCVRGAWPAVETYRPGSQGRSGG